VITEKVRRSLSEHNKVVFKVAPDATKPQIKAAIEAVRGQGQGVNTLVRKGKDQALPRHHRLASDVKKRAIVTLEEGHRST
jgi:large subunit ribosomal protein L23